MNLNANLHLAYCTHVHRGETWAETFASLQQHTLRVRDLVCAGRRFGIGLRLSGRAAQGLKAGTALVEFQRWLDRNQCYVFTIDGFAFGYYYGIQTQDPLYAPDWASPERLAYTNLLFDLLAQLLPAGIEGSVSSLPGSFKGFPLHAEALKSIRGNLWRCIEHVARVCEQTGRKMHLALEPEPLCLLESSAETLQLFDRLRAEHPRDPRLTEHLGVDYDTCHFAVEFEEPQNALSCLVHHGIKVSKIHLSSALTARPTAEACAALKGLMDPDQLHQVCARDSGGQRIIYRDIRDALLAGPHPEAASAEAAALPEWRIHLHIPLGNPPAAPFGNTNEHVLGVLDWLGRHPAHCAHLEMKTYSWRILPPELRTRDVAERIAAEYAWTLTQLAERGLA